MQLFQIPCVQSGLVVAGCMGAEDTQGRRLILVSHSFHVVMNQLQ